MKYKLLETGQGVLTDRNSIYCDVMGSAELSFLLPDNWQYGVIFTDKKGIQTKVAILSGKAKLPHALLKPQTLQLRVVKVNFHNEIEKVFDCEPVIIRSLSDSLKSQFEISGAISEEDVREHLVILQQEHALFKGENERLSGETVELRQRLNQLADSFNEAIKVINNLSVRITELEKNYDPTIIK